MFIFLGLRSWDEQKWALLRSLWGSIKSFPSAAAAATAARWWAVGVLLFSGSIYGLSLGGPRILGPVTPLGGMCMIAGWVTLLIQ